MTVNEFLAQLEAIGVTGDEQLCVHAMGGFPSTAYAVKGVNHGFDWERGKVLIHTERQLAVYVSPDDKKAADKQLKQWRKESKTLSKKADNEYRDYLNGR